ncbi:MAG: hypothetical protein H0V44_10845 [Planctomycetes bacterium]|nr:hypothetical protein [Planctomycetota bacterium]
MSTAARLLVPLITGIVLTTGCGGGGGGGGAGGSTGGSTGGTTGGTTGSSSFTNGSYVSRTASMTTSSGTSAEDSVGDTTLVVIGAGSSATSRTFVSRWLDSIDVPFTLTYDPATTTWRGNFIAGSTNIPVAMTTDGTGAPFRLTASYASASTTGTTITVSTVETVLAPPPSLGAGAGLYRMTVTATSEPLDFPLGSYVYTLLRADGLLQTEFDNGMACYVDSAGKLVGQTTMYDLAGTDPTQIVIGTITRSGSTPTAFTYLRKDPAGATLVTITATPNPLVTTGTHAGTITASSGVYTMTPYSVVNGTTAASFTVNDDALSLTLTIGSVTNVFSISALTDTSLGAIRRIADNQIEIVDIVRTSASGSIAGTSMTVSSMSRADAASAWTTTNGAITVPTLTFTP